MQRRSFLKAAAAVSVGFGGLYRHVALAAEGTAAVGSGFGPLVPDPEGILDLPAGFSYRVLARTGGKMSDGFLVPGAPDGMAAFAGGGQRVILVCNHELSPGSRAVGPFGKGNKLLDRLQREQVYDWGSGEAPGLGGTSTLVIDGKSLEVQSHYLSLVGTVRNCAGGPTPWESWITCEETTQKAGGTYEKDHGYNFEVPARADGGLADPVPLKAMGRFNHEAVAVNPHTGIVYQTEDTGDSLIYRFIPDRPGHLAAGGRLQCLAVRGRDGLDTRNWDKRRVRPGKRLETRWIDLDNVEAPENDLRLRGHALGAALFARGEGMWYGNDAIFFACTNGGSAKKGQVWRYRPSPYEGTAKEKKAPGGLDLYVEPNDGDLVDNADNLTIAPWGDVVLCEDGSGEQYVVGVTPKGGLYKLAYNALNDSEFAGAVFSPDGRALFLNIQRPGITLAITGPWDKRRS